MEVADWFTGFLAVKQNVTKKGLTLYVALMQLPKKESASFATMKMPALLVILESGLVLEDTTMTPTRVGTRLQGEQTMETNTSRPWDTSLSNKMKLTLC